MGTKPTGYRSYLLPLTLVSCIVSASSGSATDADRAVDLALVLAADVSSSMTRVEVALQRDGYADALLSPSVLAAIRGGAHKRMAVTYLEWSGEGMAQVVVKWTILDTASSVEQVAETIRSFVAEPSRRSRAGRTSISYALRYSAYQFRSLPWQTERRVIDISGDGINNDGDEVEPARAEALGSRITINGLPIGNGVNGGEPLSDYYARAVIGGDNAFIEPVASVRDFEIAMERKLQREIANLDGNTIGLPPMAGRKVASREPSPDDDLAEEMVALIR